MERRDEEFDQEEPGCEDCEADVVCSVGALDWLVVAEQCTDVLTCQKRRIALPTVCCWLIASWSREWKFRTRSYLNVWLGSKNNYIVRSSAISSIHLFNYGELLLKVKAGSSNYIHKRVPVSTGYEFAET